MQPTTKIRLLLGLGSLLATAIGGAILFVPAAFHATNGIELGRDANLLSEVRAPGAALMALGLFMGLGAFVRRTTHAAVATGALVFLTYGGGRLLSIALDGMPGEGLLFATIVELALGAGFAVALTRHGARRPSPTPA